MRPALRYTVALSVGVLVTGSVAVFAKTDHLLTISLLPLYASVSSLLIAHRQVLVSHSHNGPPARKRGAVIGGTGALTGGFLMQISIPAGIAGIGLLFLGMAALAADFDEK